MKELEALRQSWTSESSSLLNAMIGGNWFNEAQDARRAVRSKVAEVAHALGLEGFVPGVGPEPICVESYWRNASKLIVGAHSMLHFWMTLSNGWHEPRPFRWRPEQPHAWFIDPARVAESAARVREFRRRAKQASFGAPA